MRLLKALPALAPGLLAGLLPGLIVWAAPLLTGGPAAAQILPAGETVSIIPAVAGG